MIPQQIGLSEPYNYMKGCACVARLGWKAKSFLQVALSGEYDYVRASAEVVGRALDDGQPERSSPV
jgi:hypothetical protein